MCGDGLDVGGAVDHLSRQVGQQYARCVDVEQVHAVVDVQVVDDRVGAAPASRKTSVSWAGVKDPVVYRCMSSAPRRTSSTWSGKEQTACAPAVTASVLNPGQRTQVPAPV